MTSVAEFLSDVQFVVDEKGEPTAALVDIQTWKRLLALLEELEDQAILREFLSKRRNSSSPEDMGLLSWDDLDSTLSSY